ncbi:MAG TPA: restriction endonuclease subunit S [Candidatus Hydrogenedentes bacterium]|nr:restriction endonuclease subunit S [Candidatus Hydrogenedentota bacterium]
MSSERHTHSVAKLIEDNLLTIGDGYRAKNVELASTGIPFARVANIDGGFNFAEADLFPLDGLYKVGEKISRPGDVVLTSKGTVGRFAFVREGTRQFVYSPQLSYWRSLDFNTIDPYFLFYWIQGEEFQEQADGVKSQTDMADYVSLTDQRRMKITLPPLPEQRAIARILGALDDKIELNRRMNHTLEEMARALFKSWFVDFDPVTAKAEGRVPFGMNAETASQFPAEFEDTEEGSIPKGWKVGTVGEAFDLTMGQSPPGETYNEIGDGIAFYQGRTDFGTRYPTPRVYCTAPTRFANPGDTLVSVRAPVGDVNIANEKCSIGRGLASIRHKSGSRSFTYYSMLFLKEEFDVFEGEGTLFGSISGEGFRNIKIVIPSPEIVAEFERKMRSVDQTIENNESQSKNLASIRDALLPKLLSGELRVKG